MGEGGEENKKKRRGSDDKCHHLSIFFPPPTFSSLQPTPRTTGDHQRACMTSGQGLAARCDAGVGDRGETQPRRGGMPFNLPSTLPKLTPQSPQSPPPSYSLEHPREPLCNPWQPEIGRKFKGKEDSSLFPPLFSTYLPFYHTQRVL